MVVQIRGTCALDVVIYVCRPIRCQPSNSASGHRRLEEDRSITESRIPVARESRSIWSNLRLCSAYKLADDWVFISPDVRGKQPYWPENLLRLHIRPAAKRAGINKRIAWHTLPTQLRHTSERKWRERESGPRVSPTCDQQDHAGHVCTGDVAAKTTGAGQGGGHDPAQRDYFRRGAGA